MVLEAVSGIYQKVAKTYKCERSMGLPLPAGVQRIASMIGGAAEKTEPGTTALSGADSESHDQEEISASEETSSSDKISISDATADTPPMALELNESRQLLPFNAATLDDEYADGCMQPAGSSHEAHELLSSPRSLIGAAD